MNQTVQTFFEKLTHRKDRERVWNSILELRSEVLIVDANKTKIIAVPHSLTGQSLVMNAAEPEKLPPTNPCLLNFSINAEKYFMKADVYHRLGASLTLDIHQDLFKLQRRDSFRLSFPSQFKSQLEILERAGKSCRQFCQLSDLSGGGLSIEIPSGPDMNFQAGEIIKGKLTVGQEFSGDIEAVVRHVRMVGSRGSGLCRIGMEFQGLRLSQQEEIIRLVIDLHRELFSKMKF